MSEDVNNTPGESTESVESTEAATPSVQEQVNALIGTMVQDDDGKWHIPEDQLEDVPEAIVYAAKQEKRFRDTQGAYTKSRQRLKELETTNEGLIEHMVNNATLHLTDSEREELDDLRTSNPEAWREKLNEHEENARKIQQDHINTYREKGKKASESELRADAYKEFTERTGIQLSDDVITNQLPAAYTKKLDAQEWTFDQFLSEAEKFLQPKATIKGSKDKPTNDTDLSKVPGGQEPSDAAIAQSVIQSYEKETY